MEAKIYNKDGKDAGTIKLPKEVFEVPFNADLIHQVTTSMQSNKRAGTADTKDRSEVSGTGRKPWRQKGTGRSRHGSRRSPIWRTGGVAHGPTSDKIFTKKINKKMKAKALYTVLSQKMRDGQILFVDSLATSEGKTKEAQTILNGLGKVEGFELLGGARKRVAHVAIADKNMDTLRSYNNIPYIDMDELRNLNILDVLNHQYLVIENPEESVKFLASKLNG